MVDPIAFLQAETANQPTTWPRTVSELRLHLKDWLELRPVVRLSKLSHLPPHAHSHISFHMNCKLRLRLVCRQLVIDGVRIPGSLISCVAKPAPGI